MGLTSWTTIEQSDAEAEGKSSSTAMARVEKGLRSGARSTAGGRDGRPIDRQRDTARAIRLLRCQSTQTDERG